MLSHDIARCEGARGTSPEATLCRKCTRTEPTGDPEHQVFIEPMVRIDSSALGSRIHCEYFRGRGVDIDAVRRGR